MAKKFSAQVDAIILKTDKRMIAMVRESTARTIEIAQRPVAKGGKMRVDTGFLRVSGQLSFTGMPTGPVRGDPRPPDTEGPTYPDPEAVELKLAGYKLGFTIFFGWTANYARARNAYDGFLDDAVAQWPKTVADVVEEIKRRIK